MVWSGVLLVAVKAVVHQILALVLLLLFLSVSVVVSGANHAGGGGLLSTGIAP